MKKHTSIIPYSGNSLKCNKNCFIQTCSLLVNVELISVLWTEMAARWQCISRVLVFAICHWQQWHSKNSEWELNEPHERRREFVHLHSLAQCVLYVCGAPWRILRYGISNNFSEVCFFYTRRILMMGKKIQTWFLWAFVNWGKKTSDVCCARSPSYCKECLYVQPFQDWRLSTSDPSKIYDTVVSAHVPFPSWQCYK